MRCAIHDKEMRTNRRGLYCATPVGKDESGQTIWCQWKPGAEPKVSKAKTIDEYEMEVPFGDEPPPAPQSFNGNPVSEKEWNGQPESYWKARERKISLCGMVNARLQTQSPAQVLSELDDLEKLRQHIEAKAGK